MAQTPEERFWSKIKIAGPWDCWEWQASRLQGYGQVGFRGKMWKAHRVAWTLMVGEIPEGLYVLHMCDNPPCCNPAHLFLGTTKDNSEDMVSKGRQRKGDNHPSRLYPERRPRGERHWTKIRPGELRGERNANSKLTEPQVIAIMARYLQGETVAHLGREFNVRPQTVSGIVHGKSWAYLFQPEDS